MPQLTPVIKQEEIHKRVAEVALQISSDYKGRDLVLVGILKGAFIFISDLARCITIPVEIDFIRVASYGSDTSTSGNIKLTKALETDIKDKDVLIVEDIVDTGLSLNYVLNYLGSFQPKSLKVCALIDKSERRLKSVQVDYVCHTVQNGFLVGYGLDYAEGYRHLPEIYHLKF